MNTAENRGERLVLSAIHDGGTYAKRCELAKIPHAGERLAAFAGLMGGIARIENRTMGTDWAEADIAAAAVELDGYMQRHIAET